MVEQNPVVAEIMRARLTERRHVHTQPAPEPSALVPPAATRMDGLRAAIALALATLSRRIMPAHGRPSMEPALAGAGPQ